MFRLVSFVLLLVPTHIALAQDWPMWRYDAYRSAASAAALDPGTLKLKWTRQFPARKPAWDDTLNRDLMSYDRALELSSKMDASSSALTTVTNWQPST